MSNWYLGPVAKQDFRIRLNEVRKRMNLFFYLALFLPFIAYIPFELNWVKTNTSTGSFLTKPVALVVTPYGTGSAFLTGKTRLLTAAHVLCGMEKGQYVDLIFQNLDMEGGNSRKAKIIFLPASLPANCALTQTNLSALETDFAVLEMNPQEAPSSEISRFILGPSNAAPIMQNVNVIGYPGGSGVGSSIPNCTVTGGIISNEKVSNLDLFQLNVTAFPGNSGGPLVIEKTNQAVGILIAGNPQFPGITLACKSDQIIKYLKLNNIDIEK
jgi:V8-like Glu-specific endopeptidase